MNPIVVSYWRNTEASAHSNYAHSYLLRQNDRELYRVNLHLERGFFELSEFVGTNNRENFMIEQTSKNTTVKVNIFDKLSGSQIALLNNNVLKNDHEQPLLELKRLSHLPSPTRRSIDADATDDDYAAIGEKNLVVATFIRLPKPSAYQAGLLTRISRWAKNKGQTPTDVLEVNILAPQICSVRALCALSVIAHARRGLQLPSEWQDAAQQKSGT